MTRFGPHQPAVQLFELQPDVEGRIPLQKHNMKCWLQASRAVVMPLQLPPLPAASSVAALLLLLLLLPSRALASVPTAMQPMGRPRPGSVGNKAYLHQGKKPEMLVTSAASTCATLKGAAAEASPAQVPASTAMAAPNLENHIYRCRRCCSAGCAQPPQSQRHTRRLMRRSTCPSHRLSGCWTEQGRPQHTGALTRAGCRPPQASSPHNKHCSGQ
mmetsp:Transcript_4263/g.10263  ORF Transcript_4263/g.10263 Transcript_4263/m.10263 type:complete len:215 (+) Transcript_4263:248-892(+)